MPIFSYKNDITVHHQTCAFQDMKNKLEKYGELNLGTKTIIKWKQNPHNRVSETCMQNCKMGLLASSCLYVHLSVWVEQLWLPLDGFSWNLIFEYFLKLYQEIRVSLKSNKNNKYMTWRPKHMYDNTSLHISQNEMFQKNVAENIKTPTFMFNSVFLTIMPFMR